MRKIIATMAIMLASMTCMAQLTSGVYKQTRYQQESMPEQPYPFSLYKIIKPAGVMQMEIINLNPFRYVFVPSVIDKDNIIDHTEKSFNHCWICNIRNHKTIAYGTTVREHYDLDFKDTQNIKQLLQALSGEVADSKNPMIGVWKRRDSSNNLAYYKIYTPNVVYYLFIRRRSSDDTHYLQQAFGELSSVKYQKNGDTVEKGNPCKIVWNGTDAYGLVYEDKGLPVTEFWDKAKIPEDFTYWMK